MKLTVFFAAAVLLSIAAASAPDIFFYLTELGKTGNNTLASVGWATSGTPGASGALATVLVNDGTYNYSMGFAIVPYSTSNLYIFISGCAYNTTSNLTTCGIWGTDALASPPMASQLLVISNSYYQTAGPTLGGDDFDGSAQSIVTVAQGRLLVQPQNSNQSPVYWSNACVLSSTALTSLSGTSMWTSATATAFGLPSGYTNSYDIVGYTSTLTLFIKDSPNLQLYLGDINNLVNNSHAVTDPQLLTVNQPDTFKTVPVTTTGGTMTGEVYYFPLGVAWTYVAVVSPTQTPLINCSNVQLKDLGSVTNNSLNNPVGLYDVIYNPNAKVVYGLATDGSVYQFNTTSWALTLVYNGTSSNQSYAPWGGWQTATAGSTYWYRSANNDFVTYYVNTTSNVMSNTPAVTASGVAVGSLEPIDGYATYVVWYNASSGNLYKQTYTSPNYTAYGSFPVGMGVVQVEPLASFNPDLIVYQAGSVSSTCNGADACAAAPSPTPSTGPVASPPSPSQPPACNTQSAYAFLLPILTNYSAQLTALGVASPIVIPCIVKLQDSEGDAPMTITLPQALVNQFATNFGASGTICSGASIATQLRMVTLATSPQIVFVFAVSSTTSESTINSAVSNAQSTTFATIGLVVTEQLSTQSISTVSYSSGGAKANSPPPPPSKPSPPPPSSATTATFTVLLFALVQLMVMLTQ